MIEVFRKISMESIDKIIFNKQLISLIDELKSMGSKISICTGKDHERAVEILKYAKIEKKFDVLVASDDVDEPKPSAKPALFAIEKMKVSREEILHIANLANLNLEEDEIDTYLLHLQDILNFANIVNNAPVDELDITIGANEAKNVFRKDEIKIFEDNESLLQRTKHVQNTKSNQLKQYL